MKKLLALLLFLSISLAAFPQKAKWVELFNGKNMDGWKLSENASSFSVVDGTIKVDCLLYTSDAADE